eukprot:scaffold7704_cov112-Isochrysis_galbana.AAC.9
MDTCSRPSPDGMQACASVCVRASLGLVNAKSAKMRALGKLRLGNLLLLASAPARSMRRALPHHTIVSLACRSP